ncbi:branched-chain amino acid transport system II carrier protein [Selenomonas flueggei]|uniref:Branched-chain amino acid transport system carrier protein n=1 Tax=Selenomonas flueggei ATCC 43531 TaxID=638302 RepID=C4V4D8_9FIRM|nr:branched-chain amino acid transport system II carrier protein [Selenomonas flueggei]EEQ48402.1 branched-chain amino acid transport system II carrier protein [Selenomonas flueggei ATCC 43531]
MNYFIETFGYDQEGSIINKLNKKDLLTLGFMMFSIYFGAGNLIFAPALGQAAGEHTLLAIIGFMTTGVGLPLLGITAIALAGGEYVPLLRTKTWPLFATVLLVILYLIIGPLFAMPRTGAVSFEIGIRPFLTADNLALGQLIYTAIFFAASYYLALNPNKIIDRVGKMLTPALLLVLFILFAQAFHTPLGGILPPTGTYVDAPYAQGFQDGYQTMDLLASIAIGALVTNAVRLRGITDSRAIGSACLISGLITVVLMTVVYGSLAYIGATSASVLGDTENGGQILAGAVGIFFGSSGNLLLAVIIALACLTTCCGITSSAAMFFSKLLKGRISYERLLLLSILFSFAASNIGLTQIIALAVPFLVTIYPLVIVFVILSLFDHFIGWRKSIYQGAIFLTLIFSLIDSLHAAGLCPAALHELLSRTIPFYGIMMGWVCPAVIGALGGFCISLFQTAPASAKEAHTRA